MYPKSRGTENTFSQWIGITKLLDLVMKFLDADVDYNSSVYGLGHKVVEDILKPTTKKWPFLVVNGWGGGFNIEVPLISLNPPLLSILIGCKPIGLSMNVIVIGATNNSLSILEWFQRNGRLVLEFMQLEVNVFKGHKRVESMNMGLQGSKTLHKPDRGISIVGLGNRDNAARTSSRVGRLGAAGGL